MSRSPPKFKTARLVFLLIFGFYLSFPRAALVAVPWVLINLSLYRHVLPPYYRLGVLNGQLQPVQGLAGTLISPSRGLFVFSPIALLCVLGIILKLRQRTFQMMDGFFCLILLLHWVLISCSPWWWGGHSYGPRYFTDVLPYLFYFLIPVIALLGWPRSLRVRGLTVTFAAAALISSTIHVYGAASWKGHDWNSSPIELNQQRLWDWKDPQFLRGFFAPRHR